MIAAKELIWQGIVIFGGGGKSAHFEGFLPIGDCSGKRQRVRSLPAVSGEEEAATTGYFWPELQAISERRSGGDSRWSRRRFRRKPGVRSVAGAEEKSQSFGFFRCEKRKKKGIAGVFLFLFAVEKNDRSKCGSAKVSFWVTGLVGSTGLPWSDRNKEETRSGFQVKHGEDDSGDPVQAVLCSTKSGSCRGRDGDFGRPAEDLVQRLKISVHQFRRFESKEISEFFLGAQIAEEEGAEAKNLGFSQVENLFGSGQ
ncbi:hypothetical protein U1Q18_010930 [Sarracenia purpurea var. burkii]